MILTTQNIVHYILQRTWFKRFIKLEFFQESEKLNEIEFSKLFDANPRNNIFRCKISNETAFIFKQPKYLTSGTTWMIYKENLFYQYFQRKNKSLLPSFYWFDSHYHILILPYLLPLKLPQFQKLDEGNRHVGIHTFSKNIAESLARFHSRFKITNSEEYTAYVSYAQSFTTPYSDLLTQLKYGYKRPEFLNEVTFSQWRSVPFVKSQIYEFLWTDEVFKKLLSFSNSLNKNPKQMIHGDLKLDNLLVEDNKIKFIDFELVSIGEIEWDIICLIESVFSQSVFKYYLPPADKCFFFYSFIQNYRKKNTTTSYTEMVQKSFIFWAIRKIDKIRTVINISNFEYESKIIKTLLSETNELVNDFENYQPNDPKSFTKNLYHIFNNLENVSNKTNNISTIS